MRDPGQHDIGGANRDLVLAPGEYAYLQGETSGRVGVGVGPCTINQTGQDRPVGFDGRSFETCPLDESVRMCPIAKEGEYIVLTNPSSEDNAIHPKFNDTERQNSPALKTGSMINIPGPITFALWPGQTAATIPGHRLRSNQYLLIRIYNEAEAKANWGDAVLRPANTGEGQTDGETETETTIDASTDAADLNLTIGKLFVIKGTDSSFYIPPTGVEVVAESVGNYVRDAVTLERLEHTILVDENGDKRFTRGPAVVFPRPTETFVEQGNKRKARAIELHQTQGIHVKVIEDYQDETVAGNTGQLYKEGEEIFITGGINALYFPRKEHSIIQFGPDAKHYALQVPKGEGRYLLNRESGNVELVLGPKMLLPDPRKELVVRRVLSQGQCRLMYPQNDEVAGYNSELEDMMATSNSGRSGLVSERDFAKGTDTYAGNMASQGLEAISDELENAGRRTRRGDREVGRQGAKKGPKTVVVGGKFDNVPSIDLWTGYAVKVVSKTGERRVEQGPKTILLNYDENLEVLELSMGKPKNTDNLMPTVYLRVSNNKVSDWLTVETSDNIEVEIKLAYRVNFDEGRKDHWFDVENYVKLLCDHTRSILKAAAKQVTIQEFYTNGMAIVRDTILHKVKNPEDPNRLTEAETEDGAPDLTGLYFSENGMRVTDVEVLDLQLKDERISQILNESRKAVVVQNISMESAKRDLEMVTETERIKVETMKVQQETSTFKAEIAALNVKLELVNKLASIDSSNKQESATTELAQARQLTIQVDHDADVGRSKDETDAQQAVLVATEELRQAGVRVDSEALIAQFGALEGGFTEALTALSRDDVAVKIAEATSVQTMIGGRSAVDVISKILGNSERLKPFLGALTGDRAPRKARRQSAE